MKPKHKTIRFTKTLTLPALIIVAALPAAFGQLAATTNWTGADPDSENWNVAGNWDAGIPGTGSSAAIANGGFVETSATAAPDLLQLAVNNGSFLKLSHALGINGSTTGGLYVGDNVLGNGYIEIANGGELSVTGGADFRVGYGGSGTIDVGAGGSLLVSGVTTRIGRNATSSMTLADTGVITTNSEFTVGEWDGDGTLTQTGGTLTHTGGDFRVGSFGGPGGTGVFDISGGTANISNLRLNLAGAGTGTITQSGTSVVNHSGDFGLGWANTGNATYNMQGGTLNLTNRMRFGIGGAVRTNLFNQTGGAVSVSGRIDIGEDAGPTNIYQISSGSVTLTGGDTRILVGAFNGSTGTLNVSGDALVDCSGLELGATGTAAGTANLNGGTLSLTRIYSGGSTAPAQYLNLNGSTLKAKQNEGNFISGSTLVVDLQAGGGIIDSNGFDLTVPTAISGVGTLTKKGAGTLTLTGSNNYTGNTTINEGTLYLNGTSPTNSYQSNTNIATGASIVFDSATTIFSTNNFLGAANTGYTFTGSGTVVKKGSGNWQLSPFNWVTVAFNLSPGGLIDVQGGSIVCNNTHDSFVSNQASINVAAGTFIDFFAENAQMDALTGSGTLRNGYTAFGHDITIGVAGGSGTFAGVIENGSATPVNVIKSGAGIQTFSGNNTYTGNTTVSAGTLLLGADNVLPDASAVSIGTATLDAATFDDTLGTLDATGSAVINLGSGANLTFADSSAVNWTGGTLNITGTLGATSLRFGTTSGGLTPAQLALISVNGSGAGTFTLDANGYLVAGGGSAYDTWSSQITNGLTLRTDDADGDGFLNIQEFLYGTSPIAGNGSLVTTTSSGGNLVLRWLQRESGAGYTLRQSTTLAAGSWTPAAQTPALDGVQTGAPVAYDYYTVTIPTGGGKLFFRIEGLEN